MASVKVMVASLIKTTHPLSSKPVPDNVRERSRCKIQYSKSSAQEWQKWQVFNPFLIGVQPYITQELELFDPQFLINSQGLYDIHPIEAGPAVPQPNPPVVVQAPTTIPWSGDRDPNDVVAQVLNYSYLGDDNGRGNIFWYQDKSDKCKYKLSMHIDLDEIDLNAIDPRTITFEHVYRELPHNTIMDTVITRADNNVLFRGPGELNIERLQRGWDLIYSKFCRGNRKAF
jgi:hypothetical protein